ncbi:hypothetical protein VTJ04DRAFT_1720 [Mycothermus thermophilus]|uniref:uncharacterized protein n=1 Tax=Humicola insolens TaxID=85995 RepID=UPI0037445064
MVQFPWCLENPSHTGRRNCDAGTVVYLPLLNRPVQQQDCLQRWMGCRESHPYWNRPEDLEDGNNKGWPRRDRRRPGSQCGCFAARPRLDPSSHKVHTFTSLRRRFTRPRGPTPSPSYTSTRSLQW